MPTFFQSATSNAFNTTLNTSIGSGDSSIVLNSVTGLQAPGIIVIDRQDGNGNSTPTLREYVSYTSINSNTLQGCVRGRGGSTSQSHNSGAIIEEVMSIDHWNDLRSIFLAEHTGGGLHVIGTATINYTETKNLAVTSIASIAQISAVNASSASIGFLTANSLLSASGASLQGFPIRPVWYLQGVLSGASVSAGSPLVMSDPANIKWASVILQSPALNVGMTFDLKKNFSSVIAGSNVLTVPQNGTYISTSSISIASFVTGDIFSIDISAAQGGGGAMVQFFAR